MSDATGQAGGTPGQTAPETIPLTVQALEGIFKAALYDFATGTVPTGFDESTMRPAYRAL